MSNYFETSAVVKLLIDEEGSQETDALWDASEVSSTSIITYVEARAAVAAAQRGGRLQPEQLDQAKRTLQARFAGLDVIGVTDTISLSAGDLAEQHALRGFDALHLASALTLGPEETIFVTWDAGLARAALANGFGVGGARL